MSNFINRNQGFKFFLHAIILICFCIQEAWAKPIIYLQPEFQKTIYNFKNYQSLRHLVYSMADSSLNYNLANEILSLAKANEVNPDSVLPQIRLEKNQLLVNEDLILKLSNKEIFEIKFNNKDWKYNSEFDIHKNFKLLKDLLVNKNTVFLPFFPPGLFDSQEAHAAGGGVIAAIIVLIIALYGLKQFNNVYKDSQRTSQIFKQNGIPELLCIDKETQSSSNIENNPKGKIAMLRLKNIDEFFIFKSNPKGVTIQNTAQTKNWFWDTTEKNLPNAVENLKKETREHLIELAKKLSHVCANQNTRDIEVQNINTILESLAEKNGTFSPGNIIRTKSAGSTR